jgi:hypothetical protein
MCSLKRFYALVIILCFLISGFSPVLAQDTSDKNKPEPSGTPVLWRAPDDLPARDLFLGPGGEGMKPDLSKVTFIKDEKGGYSKKFRVRDGAGREWVAKVGKEAQSETAAVRLAWAVGYVTEINYLVPRLNVEGKGVFENVRLEARPEGVKRLDNWKWDKNPFTGTKELQGLLIIMALLNNWDIKDANNKILLVRNEATGENELQYIVSDLGATFGKVKTDIPVVWRFRRNRNDPEDYSSDSFLEDVKGGRVFLFYKGKRKDLFDYIKVDEARWIANLLSKLSDRQIEDAFRAANYSPEEVKVLASAMRSRIKELAQIQ